ncbi:hypothetical protein [Salinicoccus roseus]|uniref:Uncharacterized protein n=1 Tax=Salinicoccus roseus TaxID=45670 RepID=A0ABT4YLK4_9STAP|nr:hypothetical protein [Salinicoccus roseus]MDB0581365.1 hypothetical protein [Salinicoccus roseus]
MIRKRSYTKYAPKPSAIPYDIGKKLQQTRYVKEKPLALSTYWQDMYRNMFWGWHT